MLNQRYYKKAKVRDAQQTKTWVLCWRTPELDFASEKAGAGCLKYLHEELGGPDAAKTDVHS